MLSDVLTDQTNNRLSNHHNKTRLSYDYYIRFLFAMLNSIFAQLPTGS
jgi:hypothetical protein